MSVQSYSSWGTHSSCDNEGLIEGRRVIAVGLKIHHHKWKKAAEFSIGKEAGELLEFCLGKLVGSFDTIHVISVVKAGTDDGSSSSGPQDDERTRRAVEDQLATWIQMAYVKRVQVSIRVVASRSSVEHSLVGEAAACCASVLLLHHSSFSPSPLWSSGTRTPDDVLEFCSTRLPRGCRVMLVKHGKCMASKEGLLLPSSLNTPISPRPFPSPSPPASAPPALAASPFDQQFSLQLLAHATDDFSPSRLVGEGGCGQVYLGALEDGTRVAIKRLRLPLMGDNGTSGRPSSSLPLNQLLMELRVIRRVHHRNLVELLGVCIEQQQQQPLPSPASSPRSSSSSSVASSQPSECLLVFAYYANGSLDVRLRDPSQPVLTWRQRLSIAIDTSEGLKYLHEYCRPAIVHRDVKAANVLLDDHLRAAVSDFGLAKFSPSSTSAPSTFTVTAVMGTSGYVAPEYLADGRISPAIDVYAFGVILLELISAQSPFHPLRSPKDLADWAEPYCLSNDFAVLLDPRLDREYNEKQLEGLCMLASLCVAKDPAARPSMEEVTKYLHSLASLEGPL